LVVAVGFTALANAMLLASLVWREWLSGDVLRIGYSALAVIWLTACWLSRTQRREAHAETTVDGWPDTAVSDGRRSQLDQMFREAQQRYLENDWIAAEQLLLKLLKQDARDVDARLMLATLWRHQGRREEALRQLDRLERLEAADKWRQEIAAERLRLQPPSTLALPERAETEIIDAVTPSTHRRSAA
jgi:tetratricopeptide (TPR) repeat protein